MKSKIQIIILLLLTTGVFLHAEDTGVEAIAKKIFKNEVAGEVKNLVFWSKNEHFASMGIGHFIWYPKNYTGLRFDETFPDLIKYIKLIDPSIKVPKELNNSCLWNDKKSFDRMDKKVKLSIMNFLISEKVLKLQVKYMVEKLKLAIINIAGDDPIYREIFIKKFKRIKHEPNGWYVLMDYTNFKGFGTNKNERYNGSGWGLKQVFDNLELDYSFDQEPIFFFKKAAKEVLQIRIDNHPIDRKFKKGWFNRIDTY